MLPLLDGLSRIVNLSKLTESITLDHAKDPEQSKWRLQVSKARLFSNISGGRPSAVRSLPALGGLAPSS